MPTNTFVIARCKPELSQAIKIVAAKNNTNSTDYILDRIGSDPLIQAEIKKLSKKAK